MTPCDIRAHGESDGRPGSRTPLSGYEASELPVFLPASAAGAPGQVP